jgi:hypothetical protein
LVMLYVREAVNQYLSGKMWVHTGIVKTGDIVKYR